MSKPLQYRKKGKCASGKIRYATSIDAAIALGKARSGRPVKGLDAVLEVRHYQCDQCAGHHLTSRP